MLVVDAVRHYQRSIEKHKKDDDRLLHCIEKLSYLPITIDHLKETDVGKTINALKKRGGQVETEARKLVKKWYNLAAQSALDEQQFEIVRSHEIEKETEESKEQQSKKPESEEEDLSSKYEKENNSESKYEKSKHRYLNNEESSHLSKQETKNKKSSKHHRERDESESDRKNLESENIPSSSYEKVSHRKKDKSERGSSETSQAIGNDKKYSNNEPDGDINSHDNSKYKKHHRGYENNTKTKEKHRYDKHSEKDKYDKHVKSNKQEKERVEERFDNVPIKLEKNECNDDDDDNAVNSDGNLVINDEENITYIPSRPHASNKDPNQYIPTGKHLLANHDVYTPTKKEKERHRERLKVKEEMYSPEDSTSDHVYKPTKKEKEKDRHRDKVKIKEEMYIPEDSTNEQEYRSSEIDLKIGEYEKHKIKKEKYSLEDTKNKPYSDENCDEYQSKHEHFKKDKASSHDKHKHRKEKEKEKYIPSKIVHDPLTDEEENTKYTKYTPTLKKDHSKKDSNTLEKGKVYEDHYSPSKVEINQPFDQSSKYKPSKHEHTKNEKDSHSSNKHKLKEGRSDMHFDNDFGEYQPTSKKHEPLKIDENAEKRRLKEKEEKYTASKKLNGSLNEIDLHDASSKHDKKEKNRDKDKRKEEKYKERKVSSDIESEDDIGQNFFSFEDALLAGTSKKSKPKSKKSDDEIRKSSKLESKSSQSRDSAKSTSSGHSELKKDKKETHREDKVKHAEEQVRKESKKRDSGSEREKTKRKHAEQVDGIMMSFEEALSGVSSTKKAKNSHEASSSKSATEESKTKHKKKHHHEKSEDFSIKPSAEMPPPAPDFKLSHIDLDVTLPSITPNYQPSHKPQYLLNDQDLLRRNSSSQIDHLSMIMNTKIQKTKVYSGNKTYGYVPTLFEICIRILQDNIDALAYTGGVPYSILLPVLEKCSADQLWELEHHNAYLLEDTDSLWEKHCRREFRNKQRDEFETWRDAYQRFLTEREERLQMLTTSIKESISKSQPVRQTKLAYVDNVAKPPRNVARKQAKFSGVNAKPAASPASRVASLAGIVDAAPAAPVRSLPEPSRMKPKKAPLMQKTLQLIKSASRYRR